MSCEVFTIESFFKSSDNGLLVEYLNQWGIETDSIDLTTLNTRESDTFYLLYQGLPEDRRKQFDIDCRNIHNMACKKGLEAMNYVAVLQNEPGWTDFFQSRKTFGYKSLACWLHHNSVFKKAMPILDITSRSWTKKRHNLPKKEPIFDDTVKGVLEEGLRSFYLYSEGCGDICTVEMFHYKNMIYFYAYPDDHIEDILVHDKNRNLVQDVIQKTFSIVFCFDPTRGTSLLSAKGSKKFKKNLEKVFLDILFRNTKDERDPVYYLKKLLDPNFYLDVDPEDRMEARVKSITLLWPSKFRITATVPADLRFLQTLSDYICVSKLKSSDVKIVKAELNVVFKDKDDKKLKTVSFEVGDTTSTSLCNIEAVYADKIEYYLKKWGLEYGKDSFDAVTMERIVGSVVDSEEYATVP